MKKPATRRGRPGTTDSTSQIRALTSTLRQDIIDLVRAMGSASVPELAEQLGRPGDALYYHVRVLQRAGLLVEAGSRQRGRHVETLYSTPEPERRLMLQYRGAPDSQTEPLRRLVAAMLRSARREFDSAIEDPDCVVDGPARELWAGRIKGWLTKAELVQVNQHLTQLVQLLSSPRTARRNRLYSVQFVLAPSAVSKRGARVARERGSRPSRAGLRSTRASQSRKKP